MYDGMPSWYDDWKTACCSKWPHCNHCPYDNDDEDCDNEDEFDRDYDEDDEYNL